MRARLSLFVGFFLIFFLVVWAIHSVNSPQGVWPVIARQKLARRQYDAVIDVRTPMEWALGHYPFAIHIPSATFKRDLQYKVPEKRMRLLIYCNTATRARWAAEEARRQGYMSVDYLIGPHWTIS
jgi:rhodanese-related sulfurtransferase